jgi:quercetin dioxygenase-like cupin family protein
MSRFVLGSELAKEAYDWGEVGWRCGPQVTGAGQLTVMDVTLEPGGGHAFHKHPQQEEMIIVKAGRIEQWIERDRHELGPGDSVYLDADVVHASFNVGDETAHLQVVLSPCVGDIGYELVDVAGEEPWASLRG